VCVLVTGLFETMPTYCCTFKLLDFLSNCFQISVPAMLIGQLFVLLSVWIKS